MGPSQEVLVPRSSNEGPFGRILSTRKRTTPAQPLQVGYEEPSAKRIRGHQDVTHRTASSFTAKGGRSKQDEQALMDDLMAGLDASLFDNFELSPVKSQKPRGDISGTCGLPDSPRNGPPPLQSAVKLEPLELKTGPVKQERMEPVLPELEPVDVKDVNIRADQPELEDELFGFDFDLSEVADWDDEALTKPQVKTRCPLLHPAVPVPLAGFFVTPWERCRVEAVFSGLQYTDGSVPPVNLWQDLSGPGTSAGKTLVVSFLSSLQQRIVLLKERWMDIPVERGDVVNIISPALSVASNGPLILTFKDPASFIIHHPDTMLTMTSIANALPCPRKPVLQSMIRQPGPMTQPMLHGNLLHGLLQRALIEQSFDPLATDMRLSEELKKETVKLDAWAAGTQEDDLRLDLGGRGGAAFQTFARKWVGETPTKEGDLHVSARERETPSLLAITGLHDVEEDIWSPKWGLKGKVDASVQCRIIRDPTKMGDNENVECVAPLEIKTGQAIGVMAHRAQTMLYTLLMEERYGVPVPAGLLYYSQLDTILRVEAKQNEIRALICTRNELAAHLSRQRQLPIGINSLPSPDSAFLPAPSDHPRECRKCHAVDSCMLYRRALNERVDDSISTLYEEKTEHLGPRDAAFFKKWDDLLTVEEQEVGRFRSQLWTMTAADREKTGRCFSDMVISAYSNDLGKSLAKIHRHAYTFVRATHAASQARSVSLLSGHMAKGDPVSISIEPDLLCLQRGYIIDLTASSVTIGVTYVIDVEALLVRTRLRHRTADNKIVFRIDKDEMASGMVRMRSNLAQLFIADGGDEKRRRLIVDLAKPAFEDARAPRPHEYPENLNEDQRKAIDLVLTAKDYALILGLPGTGKTTTTAEIVKALVARGKSVLLTSYTHSAVDTILMKLANAEFGMLRLGNIDKVHPDVQHLTLEVMGASKDIKQVEERLMGPPLVAATCLSIEHPLFSRRKFDYCIVDEASQITLPTCLGPLRVADTFVLVGDHFQLPPIVRNPDARRGGLDVSLFRLLSEAHPQAVVALSLQYRMNEDIMLLSNRLIYEDKLKCGSDEVSQQCLILPKPLECQAISGEQPTCRTDLQTCWVQDLMTEDVKAVFVDTDEVPAYDSRIGDLVHNEVEARLVYQLASSLISAGLNPSDLAVITPYRQQIKLLTGLFRELPGVEIMTADKSQGRDKECILISLVRSNDVGNIGDLLRDWRRINVSFTRAKRKLVIFGSKRTLQSDCLLASFLKLMDQRGWVYRLPAGADKRHPVPDTEAVKREVKEAGRKGMIGERILEGKTVIKEILASL